MGSIKCLAERDASKITDAFCVMLLHMNSELRLTSDLRSYGRIGLDWIGLDWIGLDWIALS